VPFRMLSRPRPPVARAALGLLVFLTAMAPAAALGATVAAALTSPAPPVCGLSRVSLAPDGTELQWGTDRVFPSHDFSHLAFPYNGGLFSRDVASGAIERVDVRSDGSSVGSDPYDNPALDGDGNIVAFSASVTDVVPGDTNGVDDIFVHNTVTGNTTRVSMGTAGIQANGASELPAVSVDGRFVAFTSWADNLAPGDTNNESDIFLRDRQTGTTTLVSATPGGVPGNNFSRVGQFSANGRYIVFSSRATNLVAGTTTPEGGMFVRDLQLGTTSVIPTTRSGFPTDVSADGRYVLIARTGTGRQEDLLRVDRVTGTRVVIGAASSESSMTDDGRFVAYIPIVNATIQDAVVRDLETGTVWVIARNAELANGHVDAPKLSADGRAVVFTSQAYNLVPGDTNGFSDLFYRPVGDFPRVSSVDPPTLPPGAVNVEVTVSGERFGPVESVALGPGVQVGPILSHTDNALVVRASVDPGASIASRPVMVNDARGCIGMGTGLLSVDETVGFYHPMPPARLFDTRSAGARVGEGQTLELSAGAPGLTGWSRHLSAAVLNVTVTEPSSAGFLTVYPRGATRPTASNVNFVAGQTVANLVTVKVDPSGRFSIYNRLGTVHVVVDMVGWYGDSFAARGSGFHPVAPFRVLDTRDDAAGPLGPREVGDLGIAGEGSLPTTGVSAVAMNVTVTQPTSPGYLTVWPGDTLPPTASNLNFRPGQTVANLVVTKVAADGFVSFFNSQGNTHLVVDIVGWFGTDETGDGARLTTIVPTRILDTRGGAALGSGARLDLGVGGASGVPVDAEAVVANVTVTQPTAGGYLTVYPTGTPAPLASNLNFLAGRTVPNLVMVRLGANGRVSIFNLTGSSHVVVDVVGWLR
jgi:hypothetical protein